jgi:hypothetical protein
MPGRFCMPGNVAPPCTYISGWHGFRREDIIYGRHFPLIDERELTYLPHLPVPLTIFKLSPSLISISPSHSPITLFILSQCTTTQDNSHLLRDPSLTTPLAGAIAVPTVQQQRRMRTGQPFQTEQSVAGSKIVLHRGHIVSTLLACRSQLVSVIYANIPAQVKNSRRGCNY